MRIARVSTVLVPIAFLAIAWVLASKGYLARFDVLIGYGIVAFLVMWAWRRSLLSSLPPEYEQWVRKSSKEQRVGVGRALAIMIAVTIVVPICTIAFMYLSPGMSESWKSFSTCSLLIGWASKIPLAILITEWHLFRYK
jgi:uncharacterized membrane protein